MWNRKTVRGAGRAIALVGALTLVSPVLAGGLDDPGGPGICDPAAAPEGEEMVVVPQSPSPSTAVVAQLLVWRWIATLLLH
jgi:hypothetical protein